VALECTDGWSVSDGHWHGICIGNCQRKTFNVEKLLFYYTAMSLIGIFVIF